MERDEKKKKKRKNRERRTLRKGDPADRCHFIWSSAKMCSEARELTEKSRHLNWQGLEMGNQVILE